MKTVLYVEDHPVNILLVESILSSRSNVRLETATEGHAGLTLAEQLRPDLILLDLHLPDMAGDEFLQKLHRHDWATRIPVIIISADAMHERQSALLQLGVAEYITKPFDLSDFERAIDRYVGAG